MLSQNSRFRCRFPSYKSAACQILSRLTEFCSENFSWEGSIVATLKWSTYILITADNSMLRSDSSLVFKVSQPSLMSAGRVGYTPTLIDVSYMALFRFREFYIAILLASLLLSVFFLHTNLWDSIAFCQKFVWIIEWCSQIINRMLTSNTIGRVGHPPTLPEYSG